MNKTVIEIIKKNLIEERFDGLYNEDCECACELSDLEPCDALQSNCKAGYKHPVLPGYDFHIKEHKFIITECKELNQWQPIDENTPRDRRILLLYEDGDVRIDWWHHESQQDNKIVAWIELPEPPK